MLIINLIGEKMAACHQAGQSGQVYGKGCIPDDEPELSFGWSISSSTLKVLFLSNIPKNMKTN